MTTVIYKLKVAKQKSLVTFTVIRKLVSNITSALLLEFYSTVYLILYVTVPQTDRLVYRYLGLQENQPFIVVY